MGREPARDIGAVNPKAQNVEEERATAYIGARYSNRAKCALTEPDATRISTHPDAAEGPGGLATEARVNGARQLQRER